MIGEFVLFEVREGDKGESGKEGRAFVYRTVMYGFPYLSEISA